MGVFLRALHRYGQMFSFWYSRTVARPQSVVYSHERGVS